MPAELFVGKISGGSPSPEDDDIARSPRDARMRSTHHVTPRLMIPYILIKIACPRRTPKRSVTLAATAHYGVVLSDVTMMIQRR